MWSAVVLTVISIILLAGVQSENVPSRVLNRFRLSQQRSEMGSIERKTFEQPLDHFNYKNKERWNQRYYYDDSQYRAGGPLFLYIPSDIEQYEIIIEYAHLRNISNQLGGVVAAVEPRFFGRSQPTQNLSMESLSYFTIEQTLADFANFIKTAKYETTLWQYQARNVILFGIGMGASYATWINQRYPELVDGVLAYGAQVNAIMDFDVYLPDALVTFSSVVPDCSLIVDNALHEISEMISQQKGVELQNIFSLQEPLDTSDDLEVGAFYLMHLKEFAKHIQDSDNTELLNLCTILTYGRERVNTDVEAFAILLTALNPTEYLHYSYGKRIELCANQNINPVSAYRQLRYRACTQASWFQTSSLLTNPLDSMFPIEMFVQSCQAIINPEITVTSIAQANEKVNRQYIPQHSVVENVYFTYGGNDPNRLAGPNNYFETTIPVDIIPGYGRWFNFFDFNEEPDSEVERVNSLTHELILNWTMMA